MPCPRNDQSHGAAAAVCSRDADTLDTLLERLRSGDQQAFAEFWLRYGHLIRARARARLARSLSSVCDSADVLSTVSRRLLVMAQTGRIEASSAGQFWALVSAVSDNVVREQARKGVAERRARSTLRDRTAERRDEDTGALRESARERIGAAAAACDETDRRILELAAREAPTRAVAAALGARSATIRQRLSRLRRRLSRS